MSLGVSFPASVADSVGILVFTGVASEVEGGSVSK